MDTPEKGGTTPKKSYTCLSPSASNICILCNVDINKKYPHDGSKKIRLWKLDGSKSRACIEFEKYMSTVVQRNKDFPVICKNCNERVKCGNANVTKQTKLFEASKELAETYLRVKFKRGIPSTTGKEEKQIKKKLSFSKNDLEAKRKEELEKIHVSVSLGENVEKIEVNPKFNTLVKAAAHGNIGMVFDILIGSFPETTDLAKKICEQKVSQEVQSICKKSFSSKFKSFDITDLKCISFEEQYKELEAKAPFLLTALNSAALKKANTSRNKSKSDESLMPSLVNVASTLLFIRNKHISRNPSAIAMILRNGKASKLCVDRLRSLHLTTSYHTLLENQSKLGLNYKQEVQKWSDRLSLESHSITNIVNSLDQEISMIIPLEQSQHEGCAHANFEFDSFFSPNATVAKFKVQRELSSPSNSSNAENTDSELEDFTIDFPIDNLNQSLHEFHLSSEEATAISTPLAKVRESKDQFELPKEDLLRDKFAIVGDNLDLLIRRRHFTRDRQNVSLNLFHSIVVKNRVPIPQNLITLKATKFPISEISLADILPNKDDERCMREEMKMLISRDLVRYIDELKWMKKYVTYHKKHAYSNETSQVSEIQTLGILNCNEASTEGMIDILRNQHTVVPGQSNDSPTIVRTFTYGDLMTVERAQNAQLDLQDGDNPNDRLEGLIPALGDFHTYGNFLEVIWHLLYDVKSVNDIGTLHQSRNFLNARSVPKQPMKDVNACEELLTKYTEALVVTAYYQLKDVYPIDCTEEDDEETNIGKLEKLLDIFADHFLINEAQPTKKKLQCLYCPKAYTKMDQLNDHIGKCHTHDSNASLQEDYVYNYSKNALSLCLLARNFRDARRHGDGDRIERLYKYMLCYFKYDGRTKYAYQSLHLLSQLKFLLPAALSHELKWNRFVNTSGKIDGNIELDRALEHRNKYAKGELQLYQGKITGKSLARCSKSYDQIQEVLKNFDENVSLKGPTGRHTEANWENDVVELSKQFSSAQIFKVIEGRHHNRFPSIPESYIEFIDVSKFKKWSLKKVKEFYQMNIYQYDGVFIDKNK